MRSSVIAGLIMALAFGARAQENKDLERIPEVVPAQPAEGPPDAAKPRTARSGRLYVEDALTLSARRDDLVVPAPPPAPPSGQNRTSVDALKQWDLSEQLSATLSDRFNIYAQDDVNFPSRQSFRNDFREGYVTWEPRTQNYLEAGRV